MSMDVFYKFSFQDLRTSVYSDIGHSVLSLVNLLARQSGTISERAFKRKRELSKSLESH